MMGTECE
jgi:hypothetical protein